MEEVQDFKRTSGRREGYPARRAGTKVFLERVEESYILIAEYPIRAPNPFSPCIGLRNSSNFSKLLYHHVFEARQTSFLSNVS
jgi:hypothetical protein